MTAETDAAVLEDAVTVALTPARRYKKYLQDLSL
jgi:hypothetical protein